MSDFSTRSPRKKCMAQNPNAASTTPTVAASRHRTLEALGAALRAPSGGGRLA